MSVTLHPAAVDLRENTGLPWCFIRELLENGLRPDTSWARSLPAWQSGRQTLHVCEPLNVPTDRQLQPYVCLWTTVIFYDKRKWRRGRIDEVARREVEPRSYPRISFVERFGELWEVIGGQAVKGQCSWWFQWNCARNTELARHLRGACAGDWCRPCRQFEVLRGATT